MRHRDRRLSAPLLPPAIFARAAGHALLPAGMLQLGHQTIADAVEALKFDGGEQMTRFRAQRTP